VHVSVVRAPDESVRGGFAVPYREMVRAVVHDRYGPPEVLRLEDVELLKELMEAGAFRPVIDRTYPLEDVVEACRYVETGRKTGNVVLTVTGR